MLVLWGTLLKSHCFAGCGTVAEAIGGGEVHPCAAGRSLTWWSTAAGCYGAGPPSVATGRGNCLLPSPPSFSSRVYPGCALGQGWWLQLPSWCISKQRG